MMVMNRITAKMRWPSASHQPARISQMMLPMVPSGPVPMSSCPVCSARDTAFEPNGSSAYLAMLIAARAHGMPMMVIAITMPAIAQPAAIASPPKTIQSRFSRKEMADMGQPPRDRSCCVLLAVRARIKPVRNRPGRDRHHSGWPGLL